VEQSATLSGVTAKRLSIMAAALALAALVAVGLSQAGGAAHPPAPSRLTLTQMRARLAGSPPVLASLHAQAGEVLNGGLTALRTRLAALRGRPVVINKWASWCGPCRAEFGVFQRVSVSRGRQVAFLGIDSGDTSRSDAVGFLRSFPVSYPSYYDRSGQAGQAITGSSFTPVTVFLNRRGEKYVRLGAYPSIAKLERDVNHYALGG
jgi:cytochrome c biogenesis protein CcmG/thiol:disulfide interchange protein DsbE